MVRNCMNQECSYCVVQGVGIAQGDDQIKAHKYGFEEWYQLWEK